MFTFSQLAIESLAYAEPPEVWTSDDIEARLAPLYERLKLPAGRLELMTGIRERRFWPLGHRPSAASAEAGKKALAQSKFGPGDIDLVIHCAVCRDRLEPATAAAVHHELGLGQHCQLFDLSNACLGFINGLMVAGGLIESGQVRRVLLVSGENGRPLIERTLRVLLEGDHTRKSVKPYFANLTIGAGAVAAVLCRAEETDAPCPRIIGGVTGSDSTANQLCQGDSAGGELDMQTDSEALLAAGVNLAQQTWTRFQDHTGWTTDTPDRVICHQVGRRHQRALFEGLGLALDKDFSTFEEWGNVGSVSLPLTLAKARETGALTTGSKAALLGIGSGLVCAMLALEC
ncbi:3-oxoacyl-ACP synthase III [Cerasicoccus maritimus]|uniref:3-oxoacyl-ACP synthase III n=1 Tax=Cerasicoccus maritimus TaxID=490089 RepID=UPI0028528DDC|nr:3-oxoacyl-ACP synthase III [Cerasicoccus maritimus]